MGNERHPVIIIHIGDLCISSVLDNGFTKQSELAPEMHFHAFYELLVTIDGEMGVEVNDKGNNTLLSVKTGEFCFVPPGVYHCTRAISENTVKLAIRFNCIFSGSKIERHSVFELCSRALSALEQPRLFSDGKTILELVCRIRDELNSKKKAGDEYIELLLGQMYIELFRTLDIGNEHADNADPHQDFREENEDRRIKIEEYMFSHFEEQITEEDLACDMHLSKRQLSRVIRQLFGRSFHQLLSDIRLNRAAQLLIETDISIEQIALSVGYTSISGFYTAFKNKFSMSAGQYRASFSEI